MPIKQKLMTIDEAVKREDGNVAEAARKAGADYIPFYRWYKRSVYAPDHSSTRKVMAAAGIELPHRGEK